MKIRAMALAGTMLATLSLAACGEDETDTATETEPTVAEETAEATDEVEQAAGDAAEATGQAVGEATEETVDAAENVAEETAAATEEAAEEGAAETEAAAEAVEEDVAEETDETAAAGQSDGAAALAAISGDWAETEELCGSQAMTIAQDTITLPAGECQVDGSEIGDGTLSLQLSCGGDVGEQDWTIEGSQDEAEPRQITIDRGEGQALELVRCEA